MDEHAELRAEVADVVLADDGVALEFKHAGECVAEDRGAEMADVHLLGDVGAGVVDHDRLRCLCRVDAGAGGGGAKTFGEGGGEEGFFETEIDETGAGDGGGFAEVFDVEVGDDLGGDFARGLTDAFGQGHGDVGLVVGVARVSGFEQGVDDVFGAKGEADGFGETAAEEVVDGLHGGLAFFEKGTWDFEGDIVLEKGGDAHG